MHPVCWVLSPCRAWWDLGTVSAASVVVTTCSCPFFHSDLPGVHVGWVMLVTMGSSPIESVVAAGNIFLGFTESALLVQPYLSRVTGSELHAIMTSGFSTIAGIMSAPASLAVAKLSWPETETPEITIKNAMKMEIGTHRCESDCLPGPVVFCGCSPIRSETIATYALCDFANIGSLGIAIGGITSMSPSRKRDIASGAVRALIAGTIASFMTACIAGILSSTPVDINCHHVLENGFHSALPKNTTDVVTVAKGPREVIPGGNHSLYSLKNCCELLISSTLNCSWIPNPF
ncbi:hypothetical protein HPG69_007654 [Diceros bicornis minor]|uniref:Concentrative nucleoside transporter C-terminal domain-containing protein n=1 Tax=Diceros bicornis minor TaxID=77932 RepID=A0A7J7EA32_DICBM|nr:hypothetical protein HPG69_007654 [Diceros bicornis minor]